MTWAAMIMSVMLSALPAGSLPDGTTCASGLAKQAELISAYEEQETLLNEKIAVLTAALDSHKRAEVDLQAEVDAQVKVAETYKKLWQAEMEYTSALSKRANWAERFVALKWVGIGFAGGVLATEIAK